MSEALTQALTAILELCAARTVNYARLERIEAIARAALAGAAPTPSLAPETGDLDTKVGPNQCPVFILAPGPISYHCTSTPDHDGWHEVMIDNQGVAAFLAASRGASEGSRGAAPTLTPQDAR